MSATRCCSLSFNYRCSYSCSLFCHKSPCLLPISLCWLAICATGLLSPYSDLCGTPYWPNTKVRLRNRLHVGGTALAPCPTAHRVQDCLLGVAVPVRHCSNLTN